MSLDEKIGMLFRAHPWHGVSIGPNAPEIVTCYVEIVPSDTIKYEIDKTTGLLKVDRPQQFSNVCPTLYGFIPQTYCGEQHGEHTGKRTNRTGIIGDGDPLDVCILTEKSILRGDILLQAIPIGGLRMLDGSQADDKIIAVLHGDAVFGTYRDVVDFPAGMLNRLKHYFLTYKQAPGEPARQVEIAKVYGRAEAHEVIRWCREDYRSHFTEPEALLDRIRRG